MTANDLLTCYIYEAFSDDGSAASTLMRFAVVPMNPKLKNKAPLTQKAREVWLQEKLGSADSFHPLHDC